MASEAEIKGAIAEEMYTAAQRLGANSGLLGLIGAFGDMVDEEVALRTSKSRDLIS